MQMLVSKDKEPITPFLHRIASLYADHGISTVLVMGGSGDYFDVAHVVLMMDAFHPRDVTAEAKAIAAQHPYPAAATPPSSAGCFPRTRRIPKKVRWGKCAAAKPPEGGKLVCVCVLEGPGKVAQMF